MSWVDALAGTHAGNTAPARPYRKDIVRGLEAHFNVERIPPLGQGLLVFAIAHIVVLEVAAQSFPGVDIVAEIACRFGHQREGSADHGIRLVVRTHRVGPAIKLEPVADWATDHNH